MRIHLFALRVLFGGSLSAFLAFSAIADQPRIVEIAAGYEHTCALGDTGHVWCWGLNSRGQIGLGNQVDQLLPVPVTGLTQIIQITAGTEHTCALNSGGLVFCWGQNYYGQLGDGTRQDRRLTPVRVLGLSQVSQIDAGGNHTCAVSNGTAYCWGDNTYGQLGIGSLSERRAPVQVSRLSRVTSVIASWRHSCAIDGSGSAYCWGDNEFGQLGDSTTSDRLRPTLVRRLSRVNEIDGHFRHSCGVNESEFVYCWGANNWGQMGDGTQIARTSVQRVPGLRRVESVVSGGGGNCIRTTRSEVYCWGSNESGQVGDGTTTERRRATRVSGLPGHAVQLAAGVDHYCALMPGSAGVACWGGNQSGELGDGSLSNRRRPVLVSFPNMPVERVFPVLGTFWNQATLNTCFGAHGPDDNTPFTYTHSGRYHTGADIATRPHHTNSGYSYAVAPVDGEIVFRRRAGTDSFIVFRGDDGLDYLFGHVSCFNTVCPSNAPSGANYPIGSRRRLDRGEAFGPILLDTSSHREHLHFEVSTLPRVNSAGGLIRAWGYVGYDNAVDGALEAARDSVLSYGYLDPMALYSGPALCACLSAQGADFCNQE